MANDRTGITIDFYGNTIEFDKSIESINKGLKIVQSEIGRLNKEIKLAPDNFDKIGEKIESLKKKQTLLVEQIKLYKEELAKTATTPDNAAKITALNKGLAKAEEFLADVNKELDTLSTKYGMDKLAKEVEIAKEKSKELATRLKTIGDEIEKIGQKLSLVSAGIVALFGQGVSYNADIESYTMALSNFTDTAEEADEIIKQITEDSQKTQYGTDDLIKANQLLISAGVEAKDSMEVIKALGEAISATGGGNDELNRMAINLQQIKNYGKATMTDIRQFAYAGIDIYGILADSLGITTEEVKDLEEISWDNISQAFVKAGQEGGKYFGVSAKQAETLNGKLNKLKKSFKEMLGVLSNSIQPIVKNVVDWLQSIIDKIKNLDENGVKFATKMAIFVASLGPLLIVVGKLVTFIGKLKELKLADAIVKLNPKLLAIGAKIGLIVGALALLYATSEDFRNAVNNLIASIVEKVKPLIEFIWAILTEKILPILVEIIKTLGDMLAPVIEIVVVLIETLWLGLEKVVEWCQAMWEEFKKTEAYESIKNVLDSIINTIKGVYNWIISVIQAAQDGINKVKEFLGIKAKYDTSSTTKVNGTTSQTRSGGFGVSIPQQSGGFAMSGGWTLNTTINVNNNGSNLTRNDVNRWADMISDRVNERLGRLM